ncbi:MAG: class I SAM-dependent methyltransferase [Geodermatophilaceae bacterium]|nr:class I SAM-dependent methyltransferase [Geodermatophilaceae bacterium]
MRVTPKSFLLNDEVHSYLLDHSEPIDDVQRDLIEETAALGDVFSMQIAPEQGAFMTMLTRLMGVTSAIEIGTFTGYSALAIARGLPPGGRLLSCDVSPEWTNVAQRYWDRAGIADRIELRLGPALETLRALPQDPAYDLAFIDADKTEYSAYVEELYPRMRTNGLIIIDNVLRDGQVIPGNERNDEDRMIQAFNHALAVDQRFETVLLPLADGLTFLRKR